MSDIWTVQAALEWTEGYLQRKGDEHPRLSAQWLLAEACNMSRIELYAHFDKPLNAQERAILRDYVARRGAGEPLQYITGEVGFRYITVKVNSGVLIPRPETEVLVSEALALLPPVVRVYTGLDAGEVSVGNAAVIYEASAFNESLVTNKTLADDDEPAVNLLNSEHTSPQYLVADLCTGTGCIACSIAHERPDTRVHATDISSAAVLLARKNAEALNLADRINVCECDLAAGLPQEYIGSYDLVVSNPPYIPGAVMAELSSEVSDFEPALALHGGDDGLDVFRPLLAWAALALKEGGGLAVELHEECLDAAADLARASEFSEIRIVFDLAGKPRVLTAVKRS